MQIWDAIFHPMPRPDSPYWEPTPQPEELYQRTMAILEDIGQDFAQIQPDRSSYQNVTITETANTIARHTWNLIEQGRLDYNEVMQMPTRSPTIALDISVATPSVIDAFTPSSGSYGYPTQSEIDRGTPVSFGSAEGSITNQQSPFPHSPQTQQHDFPFGNTGSTRQPLFGSHLEPPMPGMPGNWPAQNDVSYFNHNEPGPSRYRRSQQQQSSQRRPSYGRQQQHHYYQQPPQ